jgi:hypothetical protein
MDNVSPVRPSSGNSGGDSGDGVSEISDAGEHSPSGWVWPAPGRVARAPSCAPSASLGGFSGGRFWVLDETEDDDGKEEEAVASEVSDGGVRNSGESSADSPRVTPSRATLGDFISRAEELGGLSLVPATSCLRSGREGIPFPGAKRSSRLAVRGLRQRLPRQGFAQKELWPSGWARLGFVRSGAGGACSGGGSAWWEGNPIAPRVSGGPSGWASAGLGSPGRGAPPSVVGPSFRFAPCWACLGSCGPGPSLQGGGWIGPARPF